MKKYLIFKGSQSSFKNTGISERAGSPKTALKKAVIGYGLSAGNYLVLPAAGAEKTGKVYSLTSSEINRMTAAPRGSRSRYYQ